MSGIVTLLIQRGQKLLIQTGSFCWARLAVEFTMFGVDILELLICFVDVVVVVVGVTIAILAATRHRDER